MNRSKVDKITARNSTIGVRAMDSAKKYADALEEAVMTIKTESDVYAPAVETESTVRKRRIYGAESLARTKATKGDVRKFSDKWQQLAAKASADMEAEDDMLTMFEMLTENMRKRRADKLAEMIEGETTKKTAKKKVVRKTKPPRRKSEVEE